MEFIKYKQEAIGRRLSEQRKEMGYNSDEIMIEDPDNWENDRIIPQNIVSTIENGRMYEGNRNFISNKYLSIFQEVLELTREQIIFGYETDIEVFVMEIFYQVAMNIHPELLVKTDETMLRKAFETLPHLQSRCSKDLFKTEEYFNPRLSNSTTAVQEAMRWCGLLSFVMAKKEVNGRNYYHFDNDLVKVPGMNIDELEAFDGIQTYFESLAVLWSITKLELICSFRGNVIKRSAELKMKKGTFDLPRIIDIDKLILKWIINDLVQIMKQMEAKLRGNDLLSIGYQIYDLMSPLTEFRYDFNHVIKQLSDELPLQFQEATKTLEDLRYVDKPTNINYDEIFDGVAKIRKEDIGDFSSFPIITDDKFAMRLEKNTSNIENAFKLMRFQKKYLDLRGKETIDNFFEISKIRS